MGVTWCTWLEQAGETASPQVVDALSAAPRLSADQRRRLGSWPGWPPRPAVRRRPPGPAAAAGRRRLPNVASVYHLDLDHLAWNGRDGGIRHDPAGLPAGRRNPLWMMFTDAENRACMTTSNRAARALLSQSRALPPDGTRTTRGPPAHGRADQSQPAVPRLVRAVPGALFRLARIRSGTRAACRITVELLQLRPEDGPDRRR